MCLACQMESDEMWLAYLEQVAQRAAQQPASDQPEAAPTEAAPAKPQPASPFACEELPPE